MQYEVGQAIFAPFPRQYECDMQIPMTDDRYEGRSKTAIGARLELTRDALGLDQQTFASRAGLKASTYNQYEKGTNQPQVWAANAICDTHRVTLDWIYRGEMSGLSRQSHDAIYAVRKLRNGNE